MTRTSNAEIYNTKLEKPSKRKKRSYVARDCILSGLIQAGVKFILDKVKFEDKDKATGNYSGASAGKGSVALATGMLSRAKGDLGAFIVLTECEEVNGECFIKDV
ncbi:hypothetical protein ACFX5L_09275 [Bacteroides sp. KG123]